MTLKNERALQQHKHPVTFTHLHKHKHYLRLETLKLLQVTNGRHMQHVQMLNKLLANFVERH